MSSRLSPLTTRPTLSSVSGAAVKGLPSISIFSLGHAISRLAAAITAGSGHSETGALRRVTSRAFSCCTGGVGCPT